MPKFILVCSLFLCTASANAARLIDVTPMVRIPAGPFDMGRADTKHGGDGLSDEYPAHRVSMSSFEIDQFPVTNRHYQNCVKARKCEPPQDSSSVGRASYYGNPDFDDYPVGYISWEQADRYCRMVGKVLPTEAQWEKAAVGDQPRDYPWGNEIDSSFANYLPDGSHEKRPLVRVGAYPKNVSVYGVYDMAGNVLQWARDWYDAEFYSHSPEKDPWGSSAVTLSSGWRGALKQTLWDLTPFLPGVRRKIANSENPLKVLRGGGAFDTSSYLKSSRRFPLWAGAKAARAYTGFRCARED